MPGSGQRCTHCRMTDLQELWKYCAEHLNVFHGENFSADVFNDALKLLNAQGDIFIDSGYVFLIPSFISEIIKPIVNHEMTKSSLELNKSDIQDYTEKVVSNNVNKLINKEAKKEVNKAFDNIKKALTKLLETRHLEVDVVLPFLWRNIAEISEHDCRPIVQMLERTGFIFTSYSKEGNPQKMIMDRLPNNPDDSELEAVWPIKCPQDFEDHQMHIKFDAGCPPSLAAHVAAYLHGWGRCRYAWLQGAVITKDSEKYRVELVENTKEDGMAFECYVRLTVRIKSKKLGIDEIFLFKRMAKFVEKEREDRLPGILFNVTFPCPKSSYCEPTIEWNLEEDKPLDDAYCSSCECEISYEDAIMYTDKHMKSSVESRKSNNTAVIERNPRQVRRDPKENEFLINGIIIDLPDCEHYSKDVANACGDAILHGARIGVGERQPAKGMLVLVGSEKQFKDIGYAGKRNKFKHENICIQDWRDGENESFILSCFASDLALFVEGKTGKILADQYTVDLPTRFADQSGGTKHKNSSAAGMKGLLAIKCSEDCCSNDGIGKDNLKIFSGRKEPILVPVPPPNWKLE